MRKPSFFIGWLLSSLLMYALFYVFHGLVTNDLLKISMPKTVFLSVAGFVYVCLGFGMSVLLDASFFRKEITNVFKRALIAGPVVGVFLYAVALTIGVSFSAHFDMINLMVDVGWQILEQTSGILIIALVKTLAFHPQEMEL